MNLRRALCVTSLALCLGDASLAAEEGWPDTVVSIEQMRLTKPLSLAVPKMRPRGELRGPVVLKVHVDAHGSVQRATLFQSSGSPAHDEAALHALRDARFTPFLRGGQAVEVTLMLPLHLPLPRRASRTD